MSETQKLHNNWRMQIYNHSPIFVQNILTTLQGWTYRRRRFGAAYHEELQKLKARDYRDLDGLIAYQKQRLLDLAHFAYENSEFYRDFYRDVDWEAFDKTGDVTLLPVLPKETVRQNLAGMYTILPSEGVENNTSGTTGTTMRTYYLKSDIQRRMAYLDFFKMQHGYVPIKEKRASFNSAKIVPPNQKKKIFWRMNYAIRQRIYSGYHCKGENIKYYVKDLNRFRPASLDGYPSAIYEVAKYILDNNIRLSFTPVAIFPTAETLLPHYKNTIEKAFGCPVRDQYASSEGAPFITECKCGRLHYCMDTGIIEFEDNGEMVVTCFETYGTPLIRYQIGDRAYPAKDESCPCGNAMPLVERIEGRSLDYIESKSNGRFTSIYLSLVSADFANSVKLMQFVQNDLDSVDVYLEIDEAYQMEMNQIILDKLHYSLGDDMEIRVHPVKEIKKDASGKFRMVINRLHEQPGRDLKMTNSQNISSGGGI